MDEPVLPHQFLSSRPGSSTGPKPSFSIKLILRSAFIDRFGLSIYSVHWQTRDWSLRTYVGRVLFMTSSHFGVDFNVPPNFYAQDLIKRAYSRSPLCWQPMIDYFRTINLLVSISMTWSYSLGLKCWTFIIFVQLNSNSRSLCNGLQCACWPRANEKNVLAREGGDPRLIVGTGLAWTPNVVTNLRGWVSHRTHSEYWRLPRAKTKSSNPCAARIMRERTI